MSIIYNLQKKDYTKALDYMNKAQKIDTNSSIVYLQMGILENILGHKELAVKNFTMAIQLDSLCATAYIERADIKKSDLSDLNKALAIDPTNFRALKMRGIKQYNNGNYPQAIADYTVLIEIAPDSAEPYFLRSGAEFALKDIKNAFLDINKSIHLNPSNPVSYYNRGVIGTSNLEIYGENVLKDFDKAIELKNDYGDAYFARAKVKYTSGDKTDACNDLQEAAKLKVEGAKEKLNEICK